MKIQNNNTELFTGINNQQFPLFNCNVSDQVHAFSIPANFTKGNCVEAIQISKEFRKVYVGPRGGKYYFQPRGGKKYIQERKTCLVPEYLVQDYQPKVISKSVEQTKTEQTPKTIQPTKTEKVVKSSQPTVKCVKVSGEFRRIHVGPKNGEYYFTPSGRKEYRINVANVCLKDISLTVDHSK